ncbi:MAG TPA: hypothetical protein VFS54_03670 [Solirubrobacterales bacterium]|nr:hypothetical protein [Solirubrobacterales bacterium]
MDPKLDDLGPVLGRWLAPFVADELERRQAGGVLASPQPLGDYDEGTCQAFVAGLRTSTLTKARTLFDHLAHDGSVDSLKLAADLSLGSPRNLPGPLTTPLKRRAKKLGLALPWNEGVSDSDRTVWSDRDEIAKRMLAAIDGETGRRSR